MRVVFVSGPYTAKDAVVKQGYIRQAKEASHRLWQEGFAVICPHTNSGDFAGIAPERTFLEGYLELLRRSDAVLLLPGWDQSRGARAEMGEATVKGIPVYHSIEALIAGRD